MIGIQILLGGIIRTSIQPNMQRLMEDVREGKLDFALTKPEDSQLLVSVREVRIWRVVDVIGGRRRARVRDPRARAGVGVATRCAFVVMLSLGAVMIYCFWLVIATLAFWIVACGDHRAVRGRLPDGPLAGRRSIPGWLRFGVTFLVPIGFAVTVPAEAVTSRLDWETVVLALGFGVALFAFTRWWWRFGLRRYSGASA